MKPKILVIDDDNSLRRVLEYNLQEEGYDVQAASSGEEGLYLFGQFQPNLVITDMKMSGMDGLMVLNSIASEDIAGSISKPYSFDRLRDVLKMVIEGIQKHT